MSEWVGVPHTPPLRRPGGSEGLGGVLVLYTFLLILAPFVAWCGIDLRLVWEEMRWKRECGEDSLALGYL